MELKGLYKEQGDKMKYKVTNKTGMLVSYAKIKFVPKETKILELESIYEHEYFTIEKVEKKSL